MIMTTANRTIDQNKAKKLAPTVLTSIFNLLKTLTD